MISLALAGKPNAGKSTFFSAATQTEVDIGNYPFTTIDAHKGITHARTTCPCQNRDIVCRNCQDGIRYVPVKLLDVAGLVPGAHEGRGLGNQFLDALTNADAVLTVVDAAGNTNAEGEPVETGEGDPFEEVDFVQRELQQWLTGISQEKWEKVVRKSRSPSFDIDTALSELMTGFGATESEIKASLRAMSYPDNPQDWSQAHFETLAIEVRKRSKPTVVVANKADVADPATLRQLNGMHAPLIPATASGEQALRNAASQELVSYHSGDSTFQIKGDISTHQRSGLEKIKELMNEYGGTGVQSAINTAVYDVLDQITVYPVENETQWTDTSGETLPDAVLLTSGATPRDLAFAIHTDIGEGYLHAIDARTNRRIGEDTTLSEGDVIKIVSTA